MKGYRHRVLDKLLAKKLEAKGAVLIEGPKWCGKTTTAEEIAKSKVMLAKPDTKENFRRLLEIDSDVALDGATPMLIDEWQTIPKLWDAVRYAIDHRREMGQFILTGSAVPDKNAEKEREHSGTGRFAWLTMRPMTLFESGESDGSVALSRLFEQPDKVLEKNRLTLDDIAFLICRGGWPMAVGLPREAALEQAFDYYNAVTKEDITRVDGVKRTSERVERLMRSLARHQGSQAPLSTLRADLLSNETATLDEDTISSYINSLKKIFVVEDLPAWNPNLRSKTAIRTTDTRYFVDPSIATAALGLGLEDRMKQPVGLLSGGQRQALTLLMATLVTPKLLLLDEHTAALDPATADKVLELTKKIVAEHRITCLMITHNMHDALALGNRTLMMDGGRIVLDIAGPERSGLTVSSLLTRFAKQAGHDLADDRVLLSGTEQP